MDEFGLPADVIGKIRDVFSSQLKISFAKIYGSRAMGTYRPGSDIDITLGGQGLELSDLLAIENQIEDLLLPYKVDLSIFEKIENDQLKEHIQRKGKVFFDRLAT